MDVLVKRMWCEVVDWIHLAQGSDQRLAVVDTEELYDFLKGTEFLDWLPTSSV